MYINVAGHGGVAQLGERTVRIRKVESSILFVSTKTNIGTVHGTVPMFENLLGRDLRAGL